MGWFKKTVDLFKGPDWEGVHEALRERTKEIEELGNKMEEHSKSLLVAVRDNRIVIYEYFTCKLADIFIDKKLFEANHGGLTYKEWLHSLLKPNDTDENFEWNRNQYLAEFNGFLEKTKGLLEDAYTIKNEPVGELLLKVKKEKEAL